MLRVGQGTTSHPESFQQHGRAPTLRSMSPHTCESSRSNRSLQSSDPGPRSRRTGLLAVIAVVALAWTGAGSAWFLTGCARSATDPAAATASEEPAASPSPTPPPDAHLTIGYGGDVLMHMPVMDDTAGGGGDIEPLIAAARPWSEGVDLALCGMEVPVAPDGVPSGYPVFGSTTAVVDALSRSGWDGCATASNHSWDQGFDGVVATADALRADSMGYSGTNRTQAEAAAPYQLYELTRGGMTVTVAQLSTTYGLNGFSADPDWAVNLNDVAWVEAQARAAREAGADVVVLHTQLGEEYSTDPVPEQTEFARAVAQTGQVDVLFGAHPHVPETNELLPGGPGGRGMWVSYSAGNFISNQSEELGTPIGEALTAIVKEIRRERAQQVKRAASKAQPKVSLVASTTMVPGAVILMTGGMLYANRDVFSRLFGG